MKSIAFIDGNHTYALAKHLNKGIDFAKLKDLCRPVPFRCNYYASVKPQIKDEHDPLRPLLDWLVYNGFQVTEKMMMGYEDATGGTRYKGSVTADIIVDLMELPPNVEWVTIFSGDGDLVRAVDSIQRRGVGVTVISEVEYCSDQLRRQSDIFKKLSERSLEGIFKPDMPKTEAQQNRRLSLAG